MDLVGGAGLAVEAAPCRLLGHLLHLVDGDWHPGGRRLLLLPSLVVVPAVGQLRVRSTDVRHRVSQSELGWVGLVEEVVGEGFGASVKWSRTVGPEQAWKVPTDTHAHAPTTHDSPLPGGSERGVWSPKLVSTFTFCDMTVVMQQNRFVHSFWWPPSALQANILPQSALDW